jgi:leucyl aminopeptidase
MTLLLSAALASTGTELAERVELEPIQHSLEVLTGLADMDGARIESRNIFHPDMPRVEAWLTDELGQWGEVTVERFETGGQDVANLILVIPGSDPLAEPVLLGAHYDSTAVAGESWDATRDPAPGADDNASGVAVLLEAARVLHGWEGSFRRPIHLVLFTAEEQGLKGSIHHVEQLEGPVHMALILDPVGHNPGGADWLFGTYDARYESQARALEATAEELAGELSVGLVDHETVGGDERSDHAPFWWADMPALHAGVYPVEGFYHTANDTLDHVDPEFVAMVTQLSVAHVADLAEPSAAAGPPPPSCQTGAGGPLALAGLLLAAFAAWLRAQAPLSVGREPQSAMPPAIE